MLKKAIITGVVFSSILLVGCNDEEATDITITENDENNETLSAESNFLSELNNEIIVSITEQTELDSESITIMLDGNPSKEMTISVGFPKDEKVDDTSIQQIVKDSIKNVSETENVTISEDNVTIQIEEY